MDAKQIQQKIKEVTRRANLPELKILYHNNKSILDRNIVVTTSAAAHAFLQEIWDQDTINLREEFVVLTLNQKNQVTGYSRLFKGATNSTIADGLIIMGIVYQTLSQGIILSHNHPSGNKKASEADITLTRAVKLQMNGISTRLLDHIIMMPNGEYFSFEDEGLL